MFTPATSADDTKLTAFFLAKRASIPLEVQRSLTPSRKVYEGTKMTTPLGTRVQILIKLKPRSSSCCPHTDQSKVYIVSARKKTYKIWIVASSMGKLQFFTLGTDSQRKCCNVFLGHNMITGKCRKSCWGQIGE